MKKRLPTKIPQVPVLAWRDLVEDNHSAGFVIFRLLLLLIRVTQKYNEHFPLKSSTRIAE